MAVWVLDHDDKRMTHNMMEKRRKDRIKQWISHIAQLLPPASSQGPDKPSTLDIMERAANYIIELKASYEKLLTEQGDAVLVEEMHKMRTELDSVRAERDRLSEVLNAAGIAALNDTSQWRGNRKSNSALTENGTSPATAASDSTSEVAMANGSDESRSKNKSSVTSGSKRRNTISVHLEQQKLQQEQQQQQQQQAMAQAMASGLLSHNGGFIYSGLPGQNLMVNSNLMVSPSGQVVVSANHQTSLTAGSASSALDGGQRENVVYGLEKSSQSAVRGGNANMLGGGSIGGLLQIAMQDAGITPSLQLDASRQSSPAPVSELNVHTDSAATDSDISRSKLSSSL
ncbi:hypothetical protein C0Q70_12107 [Pomacea canaliculata]|uniref:BHLH domain-containing protein n=1 Tax=Pomacea canaliculata TaxID=400727 RepID=A0A2T7P0P0_POMCA|nr:hypothetical protein C0Q70_12107 [Pomacea canaliculata]